MNYNFYDVKMIPPLNSSSASETVDPYVMDSLSPWNVRAKRRLKSWNHKALVNLVPHLAHVKAF